MKTEQIQPRWVSCTPFGGLNWLFEKVSLVGEVSSLLNSIGTDHFYTTFNDGSYIRIPPEVITQYVCMSLFRDNTDRNIVVH